MYKKLSKLYVTQVVLIFAYELFNSNLSYSGYWIIGLLYICLFIAPCNLLFIWILIRFKLLEINNMYSVKIIYVSLCCALLPFIAYDLGCEYFGNYLFENKYCLDVISLHERRIWFEPWMFQLYTYILIWLLLFLTKKKKNKG